jgi:hypothetical protein
VPGSNLKSIQQLSLFCSWLRKQGGLVQEVRVSHLYIESTPWPEQDAYCDVAEQLLVLSLQEAAARPSTSSSSSAAAAHAVLQLRSFSTDFVRSPALLHALPAAALTQLSLQHTCRWRKGLDLNSSIITHIKFCKLGSFEPLEFAAAAAVALGHWGILQPCAR